VACVRSVTLTHAHTHTRTRSRKHPHTRTHACAHALTHTHRWKTRAAFDKLYGTHDVSIRKALSVNLDSVGRGRAVGQLLQHIAPYCNLSRQCCSTLHM
jgi:hypothetical protein